MIFLACQTFSSDPFSMFLGALERGGLCGHFKSDSSQIHRRSSELSLSEGGRVELFWTFSVYP